MTDLNARMDDMLARYGEVCNKTVAARILGRSVNTVKAMIARPEARPSTSSSIGMALVI